MIFSAAARNVSSLSQGLTKLGKETPYLTGLDDYSWVHLQITVDANELIDCKLEAATLESVSAKWCMRL